MRSLVVFMAVMAFSSTASAAGIADQTSPPVAVAPSQPEVPTFTMGARAGVQRMAGGIAKDSSVKMKDLVGIGSSVLVDVGFWARPFATMSLYYEGAVFAPASLAASEALAHNAGFAIHVNLDVSSSAAFIFDFATALKWLNVPLRDGSTLRMFGAEVGRIAFGGSLRLAHHVKLEALVHGGVGSFSTVGERALSDTEKSGFFTYGTTLGVRIDL